MIPRYTRPEMASLWTDEARFQIWLDIETLALEQMAQEGTVPVESHRELADKGRFDTARVLEIENEVKHDVIAFLTNVGEYVGPSVRYMHRGMTSSDVLDTALAVQLKRAGALIIKNIDKALEATKRRAEEFKLTPCVGRSHGIHAEPITFGLKVLTWHAELKRQRARMLRAIDDVAVGKISGPVGTFATVSPTVEAHVMKKLGLKPEEVSTQIVARDRHASFFTALAQLATSIERCAVEIRHLQRTEVREAEEKFTAGQKGSSAMPHKRNPVLTENLSGLARLVRGYAVSAMENVALWHERDISHSAVERVIGPDACIMVDFMLARFTNVVEGLVVYPERMKKNLESTHGLMCSGTLLNTLVDKGISREDAYKLVQQHALATWDENESGKSTKDLKARVREDATITAKLSSGEIDSAFDLSRHFAQVDYIFKRVFAGE